MHQVEPDMDLGSWIGQKIGQKHVKQSTQRAGQAGSKRGTRDDHGQLWQLLRALDDPDHLEFPVDHHQRRARARFDQLALAVIIWVNAGATGRSRV
jgi:hypothetical protein